MGRQIKAIEAFEVQAVKSAEETKGRVDGELRELEATLKNIETARPFEDLTVVSIGLAMPWIFCDDADFYDPLLGRSCSGTPGY